MQAFDESNLLSSYDKFAYFIAICSTLLRQKQCLMTLFCRHRFRLPYVATKIMTFPNLADIVQWSCERISDINILTSFKISVLLGKFLHCVLSMCSEKGSVLCCILEDSSCQGHWVTACSSPRSSFSVFFLLFSLLWSSFQGTWFLTVCAWARTPYFIMIKDLNYHLLLLVLSEILLSQIFVFKGIMRQFLC